MDYFIEEMEDKYMPNMKWEKLNSKQLGQYAEYYAKMEFASYGYDVYTSEVDDHGVDFVAKNLNTDEFYEVQVKSLFNSNYTYVKKDKIELDEYHLVCLLLFTNEKLPEVFIIPASSLKNRNGIFVDHDDYEKPEWGINYSKKNLPLLDEYKAENFFQK